MRLRSVAGHLWAIAAIPLVLLTFLGMDFFSKGFAEATGIRISPWFTGDEVVRTVDHGSYQTMIHRPVFQALIGERSRGFVQIDWKPAEGSALPEKIDEEIDLDGDGTADLAVRNERTNSRIRPISRQVSGLRETLDFGSWRAVRVNLENPRCKF